MRTKLKQNKTHKHGLNDKIKNQYFFIKEPRKKIKIIRIKLKKIIYDNLKLNN